MFHSRVNVSHCNIAMEILGWVSLRRRKAAKKSPQEYYHFFTESSLLAIIRREAVSNEKSGGLHR